MIKEVCYMVNVENHIGKISVSENYFTELIRHAVCDCFGVADVCSVNTFRSAVSAITGGRLFKRKGVVVHADKNGGLYNSPSPAELNSILLSRIILNDISGCDNVIFCIILLIAFASVTSFFMNFALAGTL